MPNVELNREQLFDMLIGWAAGKMQDLETASGTDRQTFHGLQHAGSDVFFAARKAAKILLGEDTMDTWLPTLRFVCLGHDLLQNSHPQGQQHFKFPKVTIRKRDRGTNERETAKMVLAKIHSLDPNQELIDNVERIAIEQAILFTIPEWDQTHQTMFQPELFKALDAGTADPFAVSVALGDLCLCGASPSRFLRASDPLLVEEDVGLNALLLKASNIAEIQEDVLEEHLGFFRFWDESQMTFAAGQKNLTFRRVCDAFPKHADALEAAFNGFDESILRAGGRFVCRKEWTFLEYARNVGFPVPLWNRS